MYIYISLLLVSLLFLLLLYIYMKIYVYINDIPIIFWYNPLLYKPIAVDQIAKDDDFWRQQKRILRWFIPGITNPWED